MREKKLLKNMNILAMAGMILLMAAAFLVTSSQINRQIESSCYRTLRESTAQYVREIREKVEGDADLLKSVARIVAGYDRIDSAQTRQLLSLSAGNLISDMEIYFPDGRIFRSDGVFTSQPYSFSFDEAAAKGVHISGRITNGQDEAGKLYIVAPIMQEGETAALLCGIVDLAIQQEKYDSVVEKAAYELCLLEGGSGTVLIDTVHTVLGNAEEFSDRSIKEGGSVEQVRENLIQGRKGEVISYSKTEGEYVYCVYEPVGVNDWMLVFSLPESVAFREAKSIRLILYILAATEGVILAAYFAWMLFGAKRETRKKKEELSRIRYMLDVEETLFNAPRKPELTKTALHTMAEFVGAEQVFLVIEKNRIERRFIWKEREGRNLPGRLSDEFPFLHDKLCREGRLLSYDMTDLTGDRPEEYQKLTGLGIRNLMVIEVKDLDGQYMGALGAVNLKSRFQSTELLDCVMLSFSMAISNMDSYQMIEEMGIKDQLTGLQNRNSFRRAIEICERSADDSLACVYVDADGLHDINNSFGHVAGDRLLQTVADSLVRMFGGENAFRIGGDEFIVLTKGLEDEELDRKLQTVEEEVAEAGYHISVGVERRREVPLVYAMVKRAEEKMYEAKRLYYEKKGGRQQIREMNRQLEEMLTEKRDLDVFREVISSKYTGVYIVDMSLDCMRAIYIPPFFEKIIQKAGGKFSQAIKIYMEEIVTQEYKESFLKLVDYGHIEESLGRGEEPSLRYRRMDGTWLLLRIYPSPDYSELWKECIWSFELTNGQDVPVN